MPLNYYSKKKKSKNAVNVKRSKKMKQSIRENFDRKIVRIEKASEPIRLPRQHGSRGSKSIETNRFVSRRRRYPGGKQLVDTNICNWRHSGVVERTVVQADRKEQAEGRGW